MTSIRLIHLNLGDLSRLDFHDWFLAAVQREGNNLNDLKNFHPEDGSR